MHLQIKANKYNISQLNLLHSKRTALGRSVAGLKDDLYATSVSKENVNKSDLFSENLFFTRSHRTIPKEVIGIYYNIVFAQNENMQMD